MKKVALFFAFALITLFFACQKDIVTVIQPSIGKASFMTINKAKEWFNETEPKTVWAKTEKQEHYKPQWDLAVQLNGAVEVPVLLEDKTIKPTINSNNPKLYGVTRLLVASLDGHTIDAAIIKYFPTEKFVGNIEEINRDNFREKKFDGMIKLENFDFTDQVVVLIEKGELKYFMGKNVKHNPDREDYEVCYQSCTTWYGTNYGGGSSYSYTQTTCNGYYCVIVPTGYIPGSNGDPTTSTQNNGGGISNGTNNYGAGILTQNPAITTTNLICANSFVIQPRTNNTATPPNQYFDAGLLDVHINFGQTPAGVNLQINIGYLGMYFDNMPNPQALANIFNNSVQIVQQSVGTNQLNTTTGQTLIPFDGASATSAFKEVFARLLFNQTIVLVYK